MSQSLVERLANLNLKDGDAIRTSTSRKKTAAEIKKELEKEFLTPPEHFSAEWLNKLQQRWDYQTDYTELCELAPTQTRTVTRFTREGLEGKVTGYKEVTVPANSATAKNSTSILRKPASRADFVRGAAGFFPFAPGGLDGVDAIQAYEDQVRIEETDNAAGNKRGLHRIINFGTEDGLLSIPPGFTRGMTFKDRSKDAEDAATDIENVLQAEEDLGSQVPVDGHVNGEAPSPDTTSSDQDIEDEDTDIDDLLPVEFAALQPRSTLAASSSTRGGREWAHMVDINKDIPNFQELVPEMARTWPFELDIFQKEAVYHLESGDSVFVAAHTSAGKTVVAEYAIALAAKHMTKAIYTSPIKALSNQKFRDFKTVFDDVGILTGDVQINPEASCLIMTTEILRSMLYRGADLIRDVEFVIFDEVHYVNDLERGVVWEEVIIMLPEHVTLILLSATVPNTFEFASWVGRTKKKNIYVISTPKRPVPLEHYLWAGKEMHKIVDSEKRFVERGWKAANDILSGLDKVKEQKAAESSTPSRGGAPQRGARGQQPRGGQRGGNPQQRGGRGGAPPNRGQGNIARTGRGGGRTSAAQDRTVWVNVVNHLKKQNLLPCCIFVFSKKRCEENAESLSNQDFCTAAEKSAIHMTIEKSIARLKPEDRVLPQIRRIREMLGRGVAVHHGGLLPIVKEIVELLFAKTLVKVLFATETFAMGLNLPTRTVLFSGYRKHDGREFRSLLPGEYTQMAGRAGRRGLDTVGTVIIVASGRTEAPPAAELRQMMLGQPTKLRSQFRLHYNMILNLMRVEALKIEEMIKRSFSENATQALLPQHEKQVALSQANLDKIKREPCQVCDADLEECHSAAMRYQEINKDLHLLMLQTPIGRRIMTIRRLIVFKKQGIRTAGVLVEDGYRTSGFRVLAIEHIEAKRNNTDMLPYLPRFRSMFDHLPSEASQVKASVVNVGIDDLEIVTETLVKVSQTILRTAAEQTKFAERDFVEKYADWTSSSYEEQDWSKVQEMRTRELLNERAEVASICQTVKCLECPNFLKHFAQQHDEWLVKENIQSLKLLMSDQNLALLPDYNQRVEVLRDLGFVDEESRVELKGKVACEIHSADELVLSECIFENVFAEYEPEDIVALLSAFVFQEKTDDLPAPPDHLLPGIESINKIIDRVSEIQTQHQVLLGSGDLTNTSHAEQIATSTNPSMTNGGPNQGRASTTKMVTSMHQHPRFALVEVVYNWALGMSFNRITDLTDVMEGTIVRVVTRLDETCREVMSAARLVGDPTLYQKMEKAREMIRRDVVFCASLYM
ncbi:Antiviral helicase ski2 [Exophiala xenobiotica]|uniref:Antiviral helicase ski2 n=1 Tax=Lithohypha guttulata TaxID=1690604 RepID=A0ABR0K3Z0_9EURO|nr:Antiviral helicase ski2 [Lithohypha guttulata]KAK5312571.1 Antiviral helicase ski2 [Exophiala xenobiotica]